MNGLLLILYQVQLFKKWELQSNKDISNPKKRQILTIGGKTNWSSIFKI